MPQEKFSDTVADKIDTNIVSLPRFIIENQKKCHGANGDFTLVLNALQFAFKFISHTIRRSVLINLTGLFGTENATGDQQKKLDVMGDEIFINTMESSGIVKYLVSEEQDEILKFETDDGSNYVICCDPIDGSSNLDAGVAVGTIVSVFRLLPHPHNDKTAEDHVLRCGREMVAACYAMYGASTHLLLTFGQGVHGFTLDTNLGEFILTTPNLKIPEEGKKIYSTNEGNYYYWNDSVKSFIDKLKSPEFDSNGKEIAKPYTSRYIGSMVADMHRTLLYGGIYAYPGHKGAENGKLRTLYEGFPMAFLIEQAGGKAVNDKGERILDLTPTHIHDRTSVWIGCCRDVDLYLKHIGKL